MNDKELLELAAKAAGVKLARSRLNDPMHRDFLLEKRTENNGAIGWNPLTDDGDAFRLMVAIGLHLGGLGGLAVDSNITELAATRRAIVRKAADIGRAK